jgi:rhomboid family GlyGly-CTERM serine protease
MSVTTPTTPAPASSSRHAFPLATTLIVVLALAVAEIPALAPALLYERAAVLRGEFWRLWTGHLVHFGASHLFWNLVVFTLASAWAERLAPGRTRLLLALAPGIIGLALLVLDPALQTYGGLSGLAAAALAFLAFTQLAQKPSDRWFWWTVLALLLLKIAAEFAADQPLFARFAASGVRPVPLAHLAGFLAASTIHRTRRRRQAPNAD